MEKKKKKKKKEREKLDFAAMIKIFFGRGGNGSLDFRLVQKHIERRQSKNLKKQKNKEGMFSKKKTSNGIWI